MVRIINSLSTMSLPEKQTKNDFLPVFLGGCLIVTQPVDPASSVRPG